MSDIEKHLSEALKPENLIANADKKSKFVILDRWYQDLIVNADNPVTKKDLITMMDWKFTRGKSRPLMGKINALNNDDIVAATKKAFLLFEDIKDEFFPVNTVMAAIKIIADPLHGVGPATASMILAAFDHNIPFMSDAGLLAINGEIKYTIKSYKDYYTKMVIKAQELNNNSEKQWTLHDIELVLQYLSCN